MFEEILKYKSFFQFIFKPQMSQNLIFYFRFGPVCPQRLPDISNETAALDKMPKGRLEYLRRLFPFLQNQSEDCLYLNIYAPIQGLFIHHNNFIYVTSSLFNVEKYKIIFLICQKYNSYIRCSLFLCKMLFFLFFSSQIWHLKMVE